jgi:hypothetical protein
LTRSDPRGRAILGAVPESDAPDPRVDELASAWANVERDWASDDAHRRFLALCSAYDRLAEAGKRYRRVREEDPARAVEAERRIDGLLALATEQLLRQKTPPPKKGTPRLTFIAIGITAAIVGMTLWQLARLR